MSKTENNNKINKQIKIKIIKFLKNSSLKLTEHPSISRHAKNNHQNLNTTFRARWK